MKLYGFAPTRTIRALWMLRELDLDFEYVQVDLTKGEHRRPEFLAVNPAGKVPRHTHLYPIEKRLAAEIPIARQDFLDMAAVMEKHLETRPVLVGENVTVADFVAAYTLDMASLVHLLEALPNMRAYMERMYARPKAPQRIAQAFASLRG